MARGKRAHAEAAQTVEGLVAAKEIVISTGSGGDFGRS